MTFSDAKVVKLINDRFELAWEAVAPVRIVNFDLGEGRSLKGTISGEIALYFCTPEGKVFDILPALQSPAATRLAMEQALTFYDSVDGKITNETCQKFHQERLTKVISTKFPIVLQPIPSEQTTSWQETRKGLQKGKNTISEAEDESTEMMRRLASKSLVPAIANPENITIVRPGGRGYYRWEVDQRFTNKTTWTIPPHSNTNTGQNASAPALKTPNEWSKELFETILQQPLKGGETTYNSDSLGAIRIISE